MSSENGSTPSPHQKKYQQLPGEEDDDPETAALSLVDSLDDEVYASENNSLVLEDTHSIFRSSPWRDHIHVTEENDTNIETGGSTAGSTTSGLGSSSLRQPPLSAASSPLHANLIGISSRSHSSSFDLDLDDDEEAVRRYHMISSRTPDAARPAEYAHGRRENWIKRLFTSFYELRTAARQRRAARLLTMPSESFFYKLRACLLTWCCDATDRGIALVIGVLVAWIVAGLVLNLSTSWWMLGTALFVLRITARRCLESWQTVQRSRYRKQRQSMIVTPSGVSVNDAVELSRTGPALRSFRDHDDGENDNGNKSDDPDEPNNMV